MNKKVYAAVAVVLLSVAGCRGGEGSNASASPSASAEHSQEAQECFVEVIKAVTLTLKTAEGSPAGSDEEATFAEFAMKSQGTPTWDIYKTYSDMGARDLAQGKQPSAVDAVGTYAPSVKLECVRAYD